MALSSSWASLKAKIEQLNFFITKSYPRNAVVEQLRKVKREIEKIEEEEKGNGKTRL